MQLPLQISLHGIAGSDALSFENLSAGTLVHFIEDGGGEGPQAKRVSAHGSGAD